MLPRDKPLSIVYDHGMEAIPFSPAIAGIPARSRRFAWSFGQLQPLNTKEQPMQYKTIVLELLQDRPTMYDKLLRERTLAGDPGSLRNGAEGQPSGLEGIALAAEPGAATRARSRAKRWR